MRNRYFFIKRQQRITTFIERFQKKRERGDSEEQLIDFVLGVCLANRPIAKGFLSRLNISAPTIVTVVQRALADRKIKKDAAESDSVLT